MAATDTGVTTLRTIDGSGDNGAFNVTNTDFARITPAHFADGVSILGR